MKSFLIAIILILSLHNCVQKPEQITDIETTSYYLIRHAEKDRSDKTNKNPYLTETGLNRANNWARILKHIEFDLVYSTDYNRTKQTALPTASANNLELNFYNPSLMASEDFLAKTYGKTVLIVGHSNTTPEFANALLTEKKYEWIADDNNGNLYMVTLTADSKMSKVLVIN